MSRFGASRAWYLGAVTLLLSTESRLQYTTAFTASPNPIIHNNGAHRVTSATTPRRSTSLPSKHDNGMYDSNDDAPNSSTTTSQDKHPTRRKTLRTAASALATILTLHPLFPIEPASADFPITIPLLQPSARSSNGGTYRKAKRATAYLVDSTIPPTLVPLRGASKEASVLKRLGQGSGTPKSPYIEDNLTLNNMMNKGVFGAIDFVKDVTGTTDASSSDKKKPGGPGYASFLFLGMDCASEKDANLAVDLLERVVQPRRKNKGGQQSTAIGLAFAPLSVQTDLDAYLRSTNTDESSSLEQSLTTALTQAGVPPEITSAQWPIMRLAKSNGLSLLALAPEAGDVLTVRKEGLQNVDAGRRGVYVADAAGFIEWTRDAKSRLYTDRSLLKDWVPPSSSSSSEKDNDQPGDFFAERILVHETIATTMAKYAVLRPDSLVVGIVPTADVRFLGGPNGRIPRICRFLSPDSVIDEDAVTTVLLNPTAEATLSKSRFLRLEIGTAPSNVQYQTKVADYLWFSDVPKVNLLPRMMNGY